jgi:hypothetical protein
VRSRDLFPANPIPAPKLSPPFWLWINFGTFNCKALAFYQISSSVGLPMANDVRFKIILTPEIIDHQSTFEILI